MPLALMRNFEAPQDATDYYLMSGDLRVGRIYERQGTQGLEFLWALNGVFGGPHELRVAGMAAGYIEWPDLWRLRCCRPVQCCLPRRPRGERAPRPPAGGRRSRLSKEILDQLDLGYMGVAIAYTSVLIAIVLAVIGLMTVVVNRWGRSAVVALRYQTAV